MKRSLPVRKLPPTPLIVPIAQFKPDVKHTRDPLQVHHELVLSPIPCAPPMTSFDPLSFETVTDRLLLGISITVRYDSADLLLCVDSCSPPLVSAPPLNVSCGTRRGSCPDVASPECKSPKPDDEGNPPICVDYVWGTGPPETYIAS